MTPTRVRVLLGLAAGFAVLTYAVLSIARVVLPPVSWSIPATLAVVAAAVAVAALGFRQRLRGAPGRRPIDPIGAARMAALAKSCSHVGAALVGAYAGVVAHLLVSTDSAPRRADALAAGSSAVAAAGLIAGGLLLERFCRIPPSDDLDPDDDALR